MTKKEEAEIARLMGLQVKAEIAAQLDIQSLMVPKILNQIKQKAEFVTKEVLVDFSDELQDYLQQEFQDFYDSEPKSLYYDRTGDIVRALKVRITQGGGYYGLKIWFDDQEIIPRPATRAGFFNAHMSFGSKNRDPEPISIDELLEYETQDKGAFITAMWAKAGEYVEKNLPYRVKLSLDESLIEYSRGWGWDLD